MAAGVVVLKFAEKYKSLPTVEAPLNNAPLLPLYVSKSCPIINNPPLENVSAEVPDPDGCAITYDVPLIIPILVRLLPPLCRHTFNASYGSTYP